eukprot:6179656-Pleurochrysis_carterae.AAC.2
MQTKRSNGSVYTPPPRWPCSTAQSSMALAAALCSAAASSQPKPRTAVGSAATPSCSMRAAIRSRWRLSPSNQADQPSRSCSSDGSSMKRHGSSEPSSSASRSPNPIAKSASAPPVCRPSVRRKWALFSRTQRNFASSGCAIAFEHKSTFYRPEPLSTSRAAQGLEEEKGPFV